MNKNLLIKQNNELFTKIGLLKKQNTALLQQLEQQNAATAACLKQIEELKNELDSLKAGLGVNAQSSDVLAEAPTEECEEEAKEPVIIAAEEDFVLPEGYGFASNVIGDIIIKAAGYINELTASDNPNKMELVNLILGRTEIAKAEILEVVSSEAEPETKEKLVLAQYDEALSYFKSVSLQ